MEVELGEELNTRILVGGPLPGEGIFGCSLEWLVDRWGF